MKSYRSLVFIKIWQQYSFWQPQNNFLKSYRKHNIIGPIISPLFPGMAEGDGDPARRIETAGLVRLASGKIDRRAGNGFHGSSG